MQLSKDWELMSPVFLALRPALEKLVLVSPARATSSQQGALGRRVFLLLSLDNLQAQRRVSSYNDPVLFLK